MSAPDLDHSRGGVLQDQPGGRALVFRGLAFAILWIVLAGTDAASLAVGVLAVAAALSASLALLPPDGRRFSARAVTAFAGRFLLSSLAAGIDVMRRAFDPRLPLRPGFVTCPCVLEPGMGRDAFRAVMTLQPGSLPIRDEGADGMVLHCLDVEAPHEASFQRAALEFGGLGSRESRHA